MTYAAWCILDIAGAALIWLVVLVGGRERKLRRELASITRKNAKIEHAAKDGAGYQVTRTSKQASCQHPAAKRWDVRTLDGTRCGYLCAQCGAGVTLASFLRPPEPVQAYPDPPAKAPVAQPALKPQASKPDTLDEAMRRNDELLRRLHAIPPPDVLPVQHQRYPITLGRWPVIPRQTN